MKSLVSIFLKLFSLCSICHAATWIQHKWMSTSFTEDLRKSANTYPIQPVTPITLNQQQRINLCKEVLKFSMYVIGDEDPIIDAVLKNIRVNMHSIFETQNTLHTLLVYDRYGNRIFIHEVPCICTESFALHISYMGSISTFNYIHVLMSPDSNLPIQEIKSNLFAFAEPDAVVDVILSEDRKRLEVSFLETIYYQIESDLQLPSLNITYDICKFGIEDHFRLCSSVEKAITSQVPGTVSYMSEDYMYNICTRNRIKFTSKYGGFDTNDVRVPMTHCQLSELQFFLVANRNELGSVFVLYPTSITDADELESTMYIKFYVSLVPVLQYYGV